MMTPNGQSDDLNTHLADLLAAQADALLAGRAFSVQLDETFANHLERQQSADLLLLAQRVHAALVPVSADSAFLQRLKDDLIAVLPEEHAQPESAETGGLFLRWRQIPARYRMVAGVGGLTLTAGLTLLAATRLFEMVNRLGRHRRDQLTDGPEGNLALKTMTLR